MTFEENLHTLVWGREHWVVSAYLSSPSVIADGPDKGRTLRDVEPGFPLLFKVIEAEQRASLQVHPENANAHLTGGEPKTEMWVMLEDGVIYAGLKPGVGPADIEAALKAGTLADLVVRHEAKKGEAYFIPGGLVHATGENARIFEVQQSSNTTYRLYDWGRMGADGKPRPLHIAEALKSIDFSLPVPTPQKDIRCPYFDFRQRTFDGPTEITAPKDGFLVVHEADAGRTAFLGPGESLTVSGWTLLTRLRRG